MLLCITINVVNVINIYKKDLTWSKTARDHILKHNLKPRQVEQVFIDKYKVAIKSYNERLKIIGQCGKRLVTVVIVK